MHTRTPPNWRPAALSIVLAAILLLWLPRSLQRAPSAAATPHRVYVTFGFHVNLYHSFRGDSNDENGFGQDIRVIRHTLSELDRLNAAGIPVSAVWDFDNLFSLQEILPVHAPDIIHDVQRRVAQNRDEVILMSYNNGLVPAMNEREFRASIRRAAANEHGSGVHDLFGRVTPVVRPQEMMTTPGHFGCYAEEGIPYVSLYYSATPFDAFRLFSRELTPAEAHNPLFYHNPQSNERSVIVPTYHVGDLVEHVSLRDWAESLHRLQTEGRIDRDVLIFINFDADAEFWTGIDLPWYLDWVPNTGGLSQLVESVAGLEFISFARLGDYLAAHPPAGTVHFSQDTADGSFHGYHSWAEKAYVSDYWARTERNRRAHDMVRKMVPLAGEDRMPSGLDDLLERSFETRLRVLSTTNFGLAGPFLTRQREAAMAALLDVLDDCSARLEAATDAAADALAAGTAPPPSLDRFGPPLETFVHLNRNGAGEVGGDRSLRFRVASVAAAPDEYFFADSRGRKIPAVLETRIDGSGERKDAIVLRVSKQERMPDGVYFLYHRAAGAEAQGHAAPCVFADRRVLRNEHIAVYFDDDGRLARVTKDGADQLDAGSLTPYIRYRGRRLSPERLSITVEETGAGGAASVRIRGPWDGPPGDTRAPGEADLRLRLLEGVPYLFVDGEVRYPDTYRRDYLQPEKPMLARKIDAGWEEAASLELRFSARARKETPFFIHKRNYLGIESAYAVDYFRHSPQNLNLASINNHITAEYVAVTTGGRGMAVAMNTDVSANFAFCPFQMAFDAETGEFRIRANPFGTYHGDQILPPTRGNRLGYETVLLTAPQFQSAAPTYNGHVERFELMIAFFEDDAVPADVKQDLISFARPPVLAGTDRQRAPKNRAPAPLPPDGLLALPYENGILFHWEHGAPTGKTYRIRCRPLSGGSERMFTATGRTLFVDAHRIAPRPEAETVYSAAVEAVNANGAPPTPSLKTYFKLTPPAETTPEIPAWFQARILWASITAWLNRALL
jgi:hypothetical protein